MKMIRSDNYLENEEKNRILNRIMDTPWVYDYYDFPEKFKNDPEILGQRISSWAFVLSERNMTWLYDNQNFPQDLKDNPVILKARKEGWLKYLPYNQGRFKPGFSNFPADLAEDPDIKMLMKKLNDQWRKRR